MFSRLALLKFGWLNRSKKSMVNLTRSFSPIVQFLANWPSTLVLGAPMHSPRGAMFFGNVPIVYPISVNAGSSNGCVHSFPAVQLVPVCQRPLLDVYPVPTSELRVLA